MVSSAAYISKVLITIISAVLRDASRQGQPIPPIIEQGATAGLLLMRTFPKIVYRCALRLLLHRHLLMIC